MSADSHVAETSRTPEPQKKVEKTKIERTPIKRSVEPKKVELVKTGEVQFDVSDDVTVVWDGKEVDPRHSLQHEKLGPHQLSFMKGRPPVNSPITVSAEEPTVIRVR